MVGGGGGGGDISDTGLTKSGRVWRKVLEMMLCLECRFILNFEQVKCIQRETGQGQL